MKMLSFPRDLIVQIADSLRAEDVAGLRRLAYRVKFLRDRVSGLMGARFLRWIEDGEIAYLWPCCPIEVFREMKQVRKCSRNTSLGSLPLKS